MEMMNILNEVTRKLDNMKTEITREVTQQFRDNSSIDEENIIQKTTEKVIEYVKEEEDKTRRKNNLVMYNVPESDKENSLERIDEDVAKCCDIFENSLGLEKEEFGIVKVIRLGKPRSDGRNRNRPMLVKLADEKEKWAVVKKAKNLKNETDVVKRRVGIALDLTVKEREVEGRLRQELYDRRANGETGLYIKNGKLFKARGGGERNY